MAKSRGRKFAEITTPTNGVFDIASVPTITNAKLQNSAMTLAGSSVSLGGTGVADTDALSEGSSNLYFTNARVQSFLGGGTLAGNIVVPDNISIYLGSSSDFRILHNTTNTQLINATGALQITSNGGFDVTGAATFSSTITATGTITGTLATAAQTNITSLGTLTGLTSTGDVSVTGSSSGSTVLTLTSNALADTPLMVFQRTGGAVAGKLAYEDGNTAISFGTTTAHELKLLTSNTSRVEITSGGQLLINTSSYSSLGTLVIKQTADSKGIAIVDDNEANTFFLENNGTHNNIRNNASIPIAISTAGTERMRIDANGKVGIAEGGVLYASRFSVGKPANHTPGSVFTSSPSSFFSEAVLGGTTGNSQKIAIFGGSDATNVSGLSIYRYRRSTGTNWLSDGFSLRQEVDSTADIYDYINFAGGKIGIGTATPSALLNVNTGASGSHDAIVISRTTHGTVGTLKNAAGSLEVISNKQLVLASDPGNAFTAAGSLIDFQIDGGSKMSLNSSSQLYIPNGRVQAETALMGTVGGHAMFGSNSTSEPIVFSRDFSISYPDLAISVYGDIGIGTTSPTQHNNYNTLTIAHGGIGSILELFGSTTNHRHLIYNNNGQLIVSADHGGTTNNTAIYLQTDGNTRMTVSDTTYPGYVKVNGSAGALVVAPSAIVQFYSTQSNPGIGIYQAGAYSSCGAHMEIAGDATVGWSPIYINKYNVGTSTDGRWLSFGVNGYNTDSATISYNYSTGNFSLDNASDYRIKENVVNYSGGLEKIEALRVVSYNKINSTATTKIEGFIAHELQEVIPAAVSGEKDAMKVNEEGETVPDYQMLSKETLVPYLVSAIQELSAEVKALKAKLGE